MEWVRLYIYGMFKCEGWYERVKENLWEVGCFGFGEWGGLWIYYYKIKKGKEIVG